MDASTYMHACPIEKGALQIDSQFWATTATFSKQVDEIKTEQLGI